MTELTLEALSILYQAAPDGSIQKTQIEIELQKRIANNTKFSIEYIYHLALIRGKAIGMNFIPSSEAHKIFGNNITIVKVLYTLDELATFKDNYNKKPPLNTYGYIKGEAHPALSEQQTEHLKEVGFNTSDILDILHT